MNQLKAFIPNFLTLCNLFCGCIAVILAIQNQLIFATIFVGIGILFDFFDGFAARSIGVSGDLGKELDSLADLVTSGLVPGIVMVQMIAQSLGGSSENFVYNWESRPSFYFDLPIISLIGLLITLASAYRLANYNLDTRQTTDFIGLPTPANTILVLSLPLMETYQDLPRVSAYLLNPWVLIGLTIFCSAMLNVEIRMFSLKFQGWGFKRNWFRYCFLTFAVVALFVLQFLALPLIILVYILFSAILDYLEVH